LGKLGNVMIQAGELAVCSHSGTVCVGRGGGHVILEDWPFQGERRVWRGRAGGRGSRRRSHRRRVIMSHLSKGSSFWARMGVCLIAGEVAKISCHGCRARGAGRIGCAG
jgi:hypothetical protein